MTHPGHGPHSDRSSEGEIDRSSLIDPQEETAVFSFRTRQRIRESMEETHGIVVGRVKEASALGVGEGLQGDAASKGRLIGEIKTLAESERYAATQHGPRRIAAMVYVRHAYLNIAATSILMGERVTRPEKELPRRIRARNGQGKSSTEKWRPVSLSVPA